MNNKPEMERQQIEFNYDMTTSVSRDLEFKLLKENQRAFFSNLIYDRLTFVPFSTQQLRSNSLKIEARNLNPEQYKAAVKAQSKGEFKVTTMLEQPISITLSSEDKGFRTLQLI